MHPFPTIGRVIGKNRVTGNALNAMMHAETIEQKP